MYIHLYIYIYIHVYMHMCIYIYKPAKIYFLQHNQGNHFRHLTPPSTMAKFTYRRTVLSQLVCASGKVAFLFLQSWDDR